MYERPNLTFNDLIRLALLSKPDCRATLSQIYDFIEKSYPYYKMSKECRFWKNSVRHNLCKNRQFRRIDEQASDESGKPYKRGSSMWELCDTGITIVSQGGARKKLRSIRKKLSLTSDSPERTSAVGSTSTSSSSLDMSNCPYPWQPIAAEHSQSHLAIDLSNTDKMTTAAEEVHQATDPFFKPWTASPDQSLSTSHLEAPGSEELGSPTWVSTWNNPPLLQPTLSYGQSHATSVGTLDPSSPVVGGAWSDPAAAAVRAASPASMLANTTYSTGYPTTHMMPPSQCMYTDGLFWYSL
ncbi:forkhead box protein O1-like [Acanthaster planci]|uniref:Forkhead box protein O1-like n=1 Tax=Acanthaster planci TaxID=133434 RepID=A0A8B7Y2M8_ACAPL|nr:forkhead box protein O1-like [Acanthaster planci]XP_022086780.1 forkhead box protein O1-like [Acanthaster planci]XP_022086781.1 forkhead box protein O1-like [Acanthaster planci]XP_022086782.1 forkhead box protein O1-like [Acanthaster planci]